MPKIGIMAGAVFFGIGTVMTDARMLGSGNQT
jgi:hypothetical protein